MFYVFSQLLHSADFFMVEVTIGCRVCVVVRCSRATFTLFKKTGPLQLIQHNVTISQDLLIIFGRDRLISGIISVHYF